MKILIIIFFLMFPLLCQAEHTLTKACNIPRNGDNFTIKELTYIDPGVSGKSCIWDFSNMNEIRNDFPIYCISPNDTIFAIIKAGNLNKYSLIGDTLNYIGYENRVSVFEDSIASPCIIYPFFFGQKVESEFHFAGYYAQDRKAITYGTISTEADGLGEIIIGTDTINDVLRTKTHQYGYLKIFSENELTKDTITDISSNFFIQDIYQWYAKGYRYPIFESSTYTLYEQGVRTKYFSRSYFYPPQQQEEEIVNDLENEQIRKNHKIVSKNLLQSKSSQKNGPYNGTIPSPDPKTSLSITNSQNNINVYFHTNNEIILETILTNLLGQVYLYIPPQRYPKGIHTPTINTSNLPNGEYILTLIINGQNVSKKIIHH